MVRILSEEFASNINQIIDVFTRLRKWEDNEIESFTRDISKHVRRKYFKDINLRSIIDMYRFSEVKVINRFEI